MKKIVWVLLLIFILPTQAFAYEFAVKIINKTGSDISVGNPRIYPKGNDNFYAKDHATKRGDRYTITIKPNDC